MRGGPAGGGALLYGRALPWHGMLCEIGGSCDLANVLCSPGIACAMLCVAMLCVAMLCGYAARGHAVWGHTAPCLDVWDRVRLVYVMQPPPPSPPVAMQGARRWPWWELLGVASPPSCACSSASTTHSVGAYVLMDRYASTTHSVGAYVLMDRYGPETQLGASACMQHARALLTHTHTHAQSKHL